MKEIKLIVPVALLLVISVVTGKLLIDKNTLDPSVNDTITQPAAIAGLHEEYPGLPEINTFVRNSGDSVIKRFETGTGIIFLGFKECPWCQKLAPLLNEAAEAEGVAVHYLDIKKERADNSAVYLRLVSILSPYLAKDSSGQPRIYVPDVTFVRNGEIVWRYEQESATDEEKTPDTYWTDERKERATARIRDEIKKLYKEERNEGI